jgi:hypothetical protein
MGFIVTFGEGGFDPSKPNNNIIEQIEVLDPEPTEDELARQSAFEKLAALGLTETEIAALLATKDI